MLVVDDLPLARRMLARVLELQGVDVIEAGDGPSALAAARTLNPDLILLDAEMPGCNGSTSASSCGPASWIRHSLDQYVCSRMNSVSTATKSC